MKNKKYIIYILIIILVISICFICIYFLKKNNNMESNNIGQGDEMKYEIKSTASNPIKKDDIEVKKIGIEQTDGDLILEFILKNIGNYDMNGFSFTANLYDEDNNVITQINLSSFDSIKSHKNYTFRASATLEEKSKIVKSVKVVNFEANKDE